MQPSRHFEMGAEYRGLSNTLLDSIHRLNSYITCNGYEGYDPFDGLQTCRFIRESFKFHIMRRGWLQLHKTSPINFRHIVGIKPTIHPKSLGDLLYAYSIMWELSRDEAYESLVRELVNLLIMLRSPFSIHTSWGVPLYYVSRVHAHEPNVPNAVTTSFVTFGLLKAYKTFGWEDCLNTARSAACFVTEELGTFDFGKHRPFKYTCGGKYAVHNANVLVARLLGELWEEIKDYRFLDMARNALTYTLNHQHVDGGWWYGEEPNLHWRDNFHTAYIIESLFHLQDIFPELRMKEVIAKGQRHYETSFFANGCIPKYYDSQIYPIDIQCCAHAIQLLSIGESLSENALDLAQKTALWTIKNMQDPDGYFYYQKRRFLTNKIPYMRWGQTTMMLALCSLLQSIARSTHFDVRAEK